MAILSFCPSSLGEKLRSLPLKLRAHATAGWSTRREMNVPTLGCIKGQRTNEPGHSARKSWAVAPRQREQQLE